VLVSYRGVGADPVNDRTCRLDHAVWADALELAGNEWAADEDRSILSRGEAESFGDALKHATANLRKDRRPVASRLAGDPEALAMIERLVAFLAAGLAVGVRRAYKL
jgi:hypothetical protein